MPATYRAIAGSEVDPDSPVTSTLMTALEQNPTAIAEAGSGAPIVRAGWMPYDADTVGDGNDGVFYDYDVQGGVSTVETPLFEAGFEYRIFIFEVRCATANANFEVEGYYEGLGYALFGTVFTSGGASTDNTGFVELPTASLPLRVHPLLVSPFGGNGATVQTDANLTLSSYLSSAAKLTKARLRFAPNSFTHGSMRLYKRRCYL